jgi:hypothetical protein
MDKVEQVDRVAFVAMCRIQGGPPVDVSYVVMGQKDDHPGVQSYARHRLAARKLALEEAAQVAERHCDMDADGDGEVWIARTIATAIRALGDQEGL